MGRDRPRLPWRFLPLASGFGILGMLLRYGLQEIATYSGYPLLSSLLALYIGCLFMGMTLSLKPLMYTCSLSSSPLDFR